MPVRARGRGAAHEVDSPAKLTSKTGNTRKLPTSPAALAMRPGMQETRTGKRTLQVAFGGNIFVTSPRRVNRFYN
jgi:hypothetical protein